MAQYKGTQQDAARAASLAKNREKDKKKFEESQQKIKDGVGGLKDMSEAFQAHTSVYEEQFKASTVGLVSADDFRKKREMVDKMIALEEKTRKEAKKKAKKAVKKRRKKALSALSFDIDEVGVDEELKTIPPTAADDDEESKNKSANPSKKLKKNPFVDTHFLPDRERERQEQELREQLEQEWKEIEEKKKAEKIEVTYSYWDGSGHRRAIRVTKGTRVDQFLEMCRKELMEAFHELRGVSPENLMYIKEDLIIPHHYTFYDLIATKARGKSGPLFNFDVHEDIRMVSDANIEKDESHAGKILTRGWFERNNHIFPANRWEVYDPSKTYEKYTIR